MRLTYCESDKFHGLFLLLVIVYDLVGAGSAGCVLANRLSEDPGVSVLLIEAGGSEDVNFNISVPLASGLVQLSEQDWKFQTVPQKNACLAMADQVIID